MLRTIGTADMDELWKAAMVDEPVPDLADIPVGRSEHEVFRYLSELASLNASGLVCFVGGGFYDHLIPAAISHVVERGEFLTAYTPYQPEASQGTLQAIYEYQSTICRLTELDVANASLYDGGTALFEAILMALRKNRGRRILFAGSISPIYRKMVECYGANLDLKLLFTPAEEPAVVEQDLRRRLAEDGIAAMVIQYPDFFGGIHDWSSVVDEARTRGVVTICSFYPIALSLLKPPGAMGFDIAVGEGQSLGNPLAFGGPYLGLMTARRDFVRSVPGRIQRKSIVRKNASGCRMIQRC